MKFSAIDRWKIEMLLQDRPHLQPVYEHSLDIPLRVKEYDKELFVVFNKKTARYEIHARDCGESTYNCTIPFRLLDERTIRYIRKNDIRVHGDKIFKRIQELEEKAEKKAKKEARDFTVDFAKEFQSEFAKDAWT